MRFFISKCFIFAFVIKNISLIISGKVQGVYFRQTARQKAEELNISGTVRNMRDGNVMIEAEGEESALYEMYRWSQEGSPLSIVKEVKMEEGEVKNFKGFHILKTDH